MRFSTLTSSGACSQQTLKMLERRAQLSAAANSNFKMELCDEPLEKNAPRGPLLKPRKAAACRVICSAAGAPDRHRFPPSLLPGISDERRDPKMSAPKMRRVQDRVSASNTENSRSTVADEACRVGYAALVHKFSPPFAARI